MDVEAAGERLREATPSGHEDVVLAEVQRMQRDLHLSQLAALQAVHDKLAAGWVPPAR